MLTLIDDLLNRITMYRLMLYYLIALVGAAAVFGAFGMLPFAAPAIIASALVTLAACWLANQALAAAFGAPANVESPYITALILTLIISPAAIRLLPYASFDWNGFGFLVWASILAMASKYVLAINKKHLFNPAAIAVVITALALNQYASWWAGGNLPMLGFVVAGGLLTARKIQRFDLILAFAASALASIIATNLSFDALSTAEKALVHTSLLFFAFVMLTEPATAPPAKPLRIAYGALVGALFSPSLHIGSIYSTPELALAAGNIFSFAVSPKRKYLLALKSKQKIGGGDIYDFTFAAPQKINFTPGQYMEWTIDPADADARGNRRYFTIASSPTENDLRLGIKYYDPPSSFKKNLLALEPGSRVLAGQLAGDFTLPRDPAGKLAFIAGGIGITPFRSMVKYLSDRASTAGSRDRRDIILLYSNRTAAEIAYAEIFDEAARTIGIKTVYINTDIDGRIDARLIMREMPDYLERTFYLSGPRAMVVAFEATLRELGIPRARIKIDFFPGFA